MISREELLTNLQLCVDDPMWPDHVEMPKQLIRIVIEQLTRHAQRPLPDEESIKLADEMQSLGYPEFGDCLSFKAYNLILKALRASTVTSTECGEGK